MRDLRRTSEIFAATMCLALVITCPASAQSVAHLETGLDYTYVRANAPPASCPCFSANGGDAWMGYTFTSKLGLVGEVASQHASNIHSSGQDLRLTSFLAGPRYSYRRVPHFTPFVELLLGAAHAGGSLSPANLGLNASSNAFAIATGGGLDVPVTKRIAVRAARVDYYWTTFTNGVNDRQNNLRISAGMVLKIR